MGENNKKEVKNMSIIQYGLMFVLAIVLLIPYVKNKSFNSRIEEEVKGFGQEDRTEQVAEMKRKNEEMVKNNTFYTVDPFGEDEVDYQKSEMIGVLSIPKIGEELSVYDKSDSISLSEGVGLLEGTHYPTGGVGNATVLTGHDGMAEADIFRNLDKLEVGDMFIFDNGVEKLGYKVYETVVILPHETEYIIQEPDKDIMMLLTCETPDLKRGINTHRRVVYAEREELAEEQEESTKKGTRYEVFGIVGLVVIVIIVASAIYDKVKE